MQEEMNPNFCGDARAKVRPRRDLPPPLRHLRLMERRLAALKLAARVRKPLLTVATVAAEVGADCSWQHVIKAIEDGRIAWAWRINAAGAVRPEIRVLRHSARHYARTLGARPEPELTWDDVLHMTLPEGRTIPCSRLMCWWSAGTDLGRNLIDEGSLRTEGGTAPRPGPGGSLLITRDSAVEFLKTRRIA